jgi:hypothetical protein
MSEAQKTTPIEEIFEDPQSYSFGAMLKDFFNPNMQAVIAIVYFYGLLFFAVVVYSAVQFFQADVTRDQIMYAVIFLAAFQVVALMKLFAWQIVHRNNLKRDIRKLAEYMDYTLGATSKS